MDIWKKLKIRSYDEIFFKKTTFLIVLFLFSANLFGIIPPDKNKHYGAIVGKLEMTFANAWYEFKAGDKVYKMQIFLKNKFTGKTYSATSDAYGLFYYLNLPPGYYTLTSCYYEFNGTTMNYWIKDIKFVNKEITVSVHPDIISTLKPIQLLIKFKSYNSHEEVIERADDIDSIKMLFNKKDENGYWKDYEWDDFEDKNTDNSIEKKNGYYVKFNNTLPENTVVEAKKDNNIIRFKTCENILLDNGDWEIKILSDYLKNNGTTFKIMIENHDIELDFIPQYKKAVIVFNGIKPSSHVFLDDTDITVEIKNNTYESNVGIHTIKILENNFDPFIKKFEINELKENILNVVYTNDKMINKDLKRNFIDISVLGGLGIKYSDYPPYYGGLIGLSFGYQYSLNKYFAIGAGFSVFAALIWNTPDYHNRKPYIDGITSGGSIMLMFMAGELKDHKIAFLFDIGGGWMGTVKFGIYVKGFVFKVGYSITWFGYGHNITFDFGYKFNFNTSDEYLKKP